MVKHNFINNNFLDLTESIEPKLSEKLSAKQTLIALKSKKLLFI